MSRADTIDTTLDYPYSLDPTSEGVFLRELASVLDIALWRTAQIEECLREVARTGELQDIPVDPPYWGRIASGSTRMVGAIEGFLAAFARASLILYPSRKAHRARGKHLRTLLRRERNTMDPFGDRALRDGWMHLDEDIGLLAESRAGNITTTSIVSPGEPWYKQALQGSVRIVDSHDPAVALPRRGVWRLRPYFHACAELRKDVEVALTNPYGWECFEGVCGIAVGWKGKQETWMIRALTHGCPISVTASSYREVVQLFETAVTQWKQSLTTPGTPAG